MVRSLYIRALLLNLYFYSLHNSSRIASGLAWDDKDATAHYFIIINTLPACLDGKFRRLRAMHGHGSRWFLRIKTNWFWSVSSNTVNALLFLFYECTNQVHVRLKTEDYIVSHGQDDSFRPQQTH